MGHSTPPDDEALRAELRAWVAEHLEPSWARLNRAADHDALVQARREWGRRLAAGRWSAPGWPAEYGGRDLPLAQQVLVLRELVRAGAPEALNSSPISILGPILLRHGTSEQRARYLPTMLDHTEVWCQGFSEPEAGSDLASLSTEIRRRDGCLRVYGQKVWTSYAQHADYCYALVRSDPYGRRHRGLTLVLVPMRQEGVTVRPLRNMAGTSEFAEVFFDGARVAPEGVVGEWNEGWRVATDGLVFERGLTVAGRIFRLRIDLETVVRPALERKVGRALGLEAGFRDRLVDMLVESRALESHVTRLLGRLEDGGPDGSHAPIAKLRWSEVHQRIWDLALEVREGALWELDSQDVVTEHLFSRAATIYAGTSEIQRNLVARALGLPSSAGGP